VFKDDLKGEQIIIFGMNSRHDDLARCLKKKEILSAGFVKIDITEQPNGRSVSMKLDSREKEDKHLLKILGSV